MTRKRRVVPGMRGIASVPTYVVMQPTTLCNLDCVYCYLPFRSEQRRMSVRVAAAVADAVNVWAADGRFSVVWHGGEPLATGRRHLAELLAPFSPGVEHHVQTNATLIDDAWCEFFAEHRIRLSVSVDGPRKRNGYRVDRGGKPRYDRVMDGVAALRRHGLPFSVLCVVSRPTPGLAAELYEYFLDLGCDVLGINIEEQEGVNQRGNAIRAPRCGLLARARGGVAARPAHPRARDRVGAAVRRQRCWTAPPTTCCPPHSTRSRRSADDGSVVLLSPELAGFTDAALRRLRHPATSSTTPLAEILAAPERTAGWMREFLAGVEACRSTCPYFGFCGGAHAANRYFEHGRFDGTETDHCRNSKIRLLEGVLDHAGDGDPSA